jgi:mono/diheme cytochrome c family protein
MRIVLNIVLLLAVLLLVGANFALRPNPARLNFEFIPQMTHSPRYNSFASNPNFPDRKTLQAPPAGTIPRGLKPLHYATTPQGEPLGGEELNQPTDLSSEQVRERSATVFANYCAVCHGAGGADNGPVTQRGVPPPPSLLAEHAVKMNDSQLFQVLAFGQNNMPSYASQLSRTDRWNAIAYVRSLQKQAASSATAAGAQAPAQTSSGGHP